MQLASPTTLATGLNQENPLNANSTPKAQHRFVKLLWVLGLIAGVVVGAAVGFGIAGTQGERPVAATRAA